MTTEESKKEQLDFGFAGLSSMVSDIGTIVKEAQAKKLSHDTISAENHPETNLIKDTEPSSEPIQKASTTSWMLGVKRIIIGCLAVTFFYWCWLSSAGEAITNAKSQNTNPALTRPLISPQTSSQQISERPPISNRPSEEKPKIGIKNILEIAQIRWCLAEKIRIETARKIVNGYIASDVNRFNKMVGNYNRRCGNFRYRPSNFESAKSYIKNYRAVLESEGAALFSRSTISVNSSDNHALPDKTLQEIQKKLNQLGYDSGYPDGFLGVKTKRAILKFQGDMRINTDKLTNKTLLKHLSLAKLKKEKQLKIQKNFITSTEKRKNVDAHHSLKSEIPQHAELDYLGHGWVCSRGYKQNGNECIKVVIPQNAELDYLGHSW
ncbi:peptidoglycan-binding domain-containing protein, partial [Legionella qingyii]